LNVAAPRTADALGERLARLRAQRRDPGWATELLTLGRELTMAVAGAVLARGAEGWQAIAPATAEAVPPAWVALADAAAMRGGLATATTGQDGHWLFAASAGPADPPGTAPRHAVLLLEVNTSLQMDLVLTRERMAFLGALADGAATEAALQAQTPLALATAAAEALLRFPDRSEGLHAAAAVVAHALPGAERVALVLPRLQALGLSDQRVTDRGAELPRRLRALAQEALDRAEPRLATLADAPSPAERAHAEAFGPRALLTIPAPAGGVVVVVAFAPGVEIGKEAAQRLAATAALLGALAESRPARRPPRKGLMVLSALAAILVALAVVPRDATVEAPVVLMPERAQAITAPFDGILEASSARPGDPVTGGDTQLARLVTREVELELAAARARLANDRRDATVARAGGQPAQEQIALLAARRAEAQVALLEYRVRLADIRAPESGVIITGDLRRSLGQPVSRGQVLFELALEGPLRAEVLVLDEHAPRVREGQRVRFATAAEPGLIREATVERIRPMAETVQGRNVFRVMARIDPQPESLGELRPGMEGWARVVTGRTTWLLWLLRDPIRWVRRQFWI
jgi:hypothetical protein